MKHIYFVQLAIAERESNSSYLREITKTTIYGFPDEVAAHDKALAIGQNIVKNNTIGKAEIKQELGEIGGSIEISFAHSVHENPFKRYTIIFG